MNIPTIKTAIVTYVHQSMTLMFTHPFMPLIEPTITSSTKDIMHSHMIHHPILLFVFILLCRHRAINIDMHKYMVSEHIPIYFIRNLSKNLGYLIHQPPIII